MLEQNIHHLPLVEEGRVIGVISGSDLLQHQARNPIYLRRTLDHLNDPLEVRHYAREITITAQTLFQGGIGAVQIGQVVSSLNDALVMRLVGLAEKSSDRHRRRLLGLCSAPKGAWNKRSSQIRITR